VRACRVAVLRHRREDPRPTRPHRRRPQSRGLARGERLELWADPDDLRERGLRLARDLGLGELPSRPAIQGSDHFPFASAGIPAACLVRWPYPEYHLGSDRPELADEALLTPATELATRLVEELLA
jgi:hypothetical protein